MPTVCACSRDLLPARSSRGHYTTCKNRIPPNWTLCASFTQCGNTKKKQAASRVFKVAKIWIGARQEQDIFHFCSCAIFQHCKFWFAMRHFQRNKNRTATQVRLWFYSQEAVSRKPLPSCDASLSPSVRQHLTSSADWSFATANKIVLCYRGDFCLNRFWSCWWSRSRPSGCRCWLKNP